MVLMRHTVLIPQILAAQKKQTIRAPRKYPLNTGHTLNHYLLFKIGDSRIESIRDTTLAAITEEEAIEDGFKTKEQCIEALAAIHELTLPADNEPFQVIKYKPQWEPMYLISRATLLSLKAAAAVRDLILGPEMTKAKEEELRFNIQLIKRKLEDIQQLKLVSIQDPTPKPYKPKRTRCSEDGCLCFVRPDAKLPYCSHHLKKHLQKKLPVQSTLKS